MSKIVRLSLQNVRCLGDTQSVDMGKITLLVGENSTGKSTFLGCCNAFSRLASLRGLQDPGPENPSCFDKKPFSMGRFGTIARHGANAFSLAGSFQEHCHTMIGLTFSADRSGHPAEAQFRVELPPRNGVERHLSVTRVPESPEMWSFEANGFHFDIPQHAFSYRQFSTWLSTAVRHGYMPFAGNSEIYRKAGKSSTDHDASSFAKLINFLQEMPLPQESLPVCAVTPGVVWRQREFSSDTIPRWDDDLRNFISEEGRKLGLFSDIDVRVGPDGQHEIHVQQSGGWYNIVDTGFGVSSIVPLLHAMYRHQDGTTFLLQQPEINVHPSAQADLAQMMADSPHRFVIETHSDHLIDRFRICVMEKVLAPDELRIAYFQRAPEREGVAIYNISVDEDGNLDGAPAGYRKFFMDETNRLLGFSGR